MATVVQGTLTGLYDEVVTDVAVDAAFEGSQTTPGLFNMREMAGRRERFQTVGSLPNWTPKSETVAADEQVPVQQYSKTYVASAYSQVVSYSREAAADEEWGYFQSLGEQLGDSFAQTVEQKGADFFNDLVTGATYVGIDGLAFASNAHVNADSANSQDNLLAGTSLSMSGLKSARTAMRKFTNSQGTAFLKRKPDLLIVPVDLEQDAFELVRSSLRPDNANMAANINAGALSIVSWEELSDTNDWILADSKAMSRELKWLWRDPMEMFGAGDLRTQTRTIGGYTRFVLGGNGWSWMVYCQG